MKYTQQQIADLYASEAKRHGETGTSTIQDMRTRELEMRAIFSYVRDGMAIMEVGCGNGFVAEHLVQQFAVALDAFDFSPELIAIALGRNLASAQGTVRFSQQDVLELDIQARYDLAFTERVLQNLLDWPAQQAALKRIIRALKPGGLLVMEECFWSGLNTLNAARIELEIKPIQESWHNTFFRDADVLAYMPTIGADLVEENRFLSGYYFGSRVLLPALLPKGKKAAHASVLNDFFAELPAAGNFSPMKIMVFRKSLSRTPQIAAQGTGL